MDIAVLLLGQGADVNIMDAGGDAPLHLASDNGRRDHVDLLLKHHADVNLLNGHHSTTALRVAVIMGEIEIARTLLQHGAAVDIPCNEGWTPLKSASRYG